MHWQVWQHLLFSLRQPRRGPPARTWHRVPRLEHLEARLPPAAHDTLGTAFPLSFAAGPVADASGTLTTADQVNLYAVNLAAHDQLTATINAQGQGSPLHAALRLFDSTGTALPASDSSIGGDPQLTFGVPASGIYYVGVSSAGDQDYSPTTSGSGAGGTSTGLYSLSVNDLLARFVNATALDNSGQVLQASLTGGQPDDFSVTVTSDTYLLATAVPQASPGFEPHLLLYDGTGELLIQSDQHTRGTAGATVEQHLQAGSYYLEVSAAAGTSSLGSREAFQLTTVLADSLPAFAPLPAEGGTTSVAVADLAGDGIPDIVTTEGYNGLSILLGNGDGTFQPARSIAVPGGAGAIVVADLTGDGIPDIVTTTGYNTVSVLLGRGDGTFQPAQSFGVGGGPNSVAVADLTGNGIPDIVTANYGVVIEGYRIVDSASTVSVLLGNGDGTFQPAQSFAVGSEPLSVAVADLTGDGIPDIVTANFLAKTVSVLLGNGDGTFQPAQSFAVGTYPHSVAVADLTGDGIPDIVTANSGGVNTADSGTVSVLLGNRDGTFQPARSFPVGAYPVSVTVADLTGNGIPDIVTANYGVVIEGYLGIVDSASAVSVLLGNGDGNFQPARSFAVGDGPDSVAVADLTGDHIPDIVTANSGSFSLGNSANTVSVLLGNGDGTFQTAQSFAVGDEPCSVAVVDLTGDGIPDIVTANSGDNTVSVLLGNGNGTFQPARSFGVGDGPCSVAVADLTGDGIPDIVTANLFANTVSVLLGNGDGTFQPAQSFAVGTYPTSVAVADLTGDGIPDIITAAGDGLIVLLGNGDGTFQPAFSIPVPNGAGGFAVADLSGDGHPDIITGGYDCVNELLGNGDGTFQPAFSIPVPNGTGALAVADLTGDGILDIVTANLGDSTVSVLLGNGDGTFQPARSFPVGRYPSFVAVGDLTGDGISDIVTANYGSNTVSVLLGNGNGTFQPARSITGGPGPNSVAVADLTGDGRADIVTANYFNSTVSVLLNQGNGQFQPPTVASSVPSRDIPQVIDLTRTGIPGALTLDQRTGQILFRQGTGDPNNPFLPFVAVNPDHPATDFTLVQTGGVPEIAALDSSAQQVFVYAWSSTQQQFTPIGSFATGPDPVRIASADLDGTGLGDIVVANDLDNTLTIALQQSPGIFDTFTRDVGSDPSSISFADMNGDGLLDIVVSDQVSGDVSVLFNNDSHSFTAQERYRAGQGPFDVNTGPTGTTIVSQLETVGVVAGDFTGDGGTDLVALDANSDSFSLLRAAGDGSLIDPQLTDRYLVGPGAVQALVGDFLHNGRQDLAVLTTQQNASDPTEPGTSEVLVFLNNGDGTFSDPIISPAGQGATGFSFVAAPTVSVGPEMPDQLLVGNAYGDFLTLLGLGNGRFIVDRGSLDGKPLAVGKTSDGRTFVVVADQSEDRVQVYFQNAGASASGSSPFVLSATLPSTPALLAPGAVQLVDLNKSGSGNGTLDLVVASKLGNDVLVYPGLPGGGFGAPQDLSVGFEPVAITVGDFTGNGIPDLAVANQGSNDVSVLLGIVDSNGNWTGFTHGERTSSGGSEPLSVQAGNFTGRPGILDLRVTNAGGQVSTLPGIGSNDQGSGFFLGNHPQTVTLGSTIVQSTFDPSTGNEFVVLQDGSLRSLDGADLIPSGVTAVSATDGILIAGLADGDVEVMTDTGAGKEIQPPEFIDQPSALEALVSGNQIDVYATYQAQDAPVLFSFAVPVITELPSTGLTDVQTTSSVAQASGLSNTNLILAAVLLQGNLVERVEAAAAEAVPGEETFSLFAQATAARTAAPALFSDAAVNDNLPADAALALPPAADVPVEVPLQSFRIGVEEALRQQMREPRPAPRNDAMPEGRQGMLPALPDAQDQPPVEMKQSAAEQEEETAVNEQEPGEETAFPPLSTEAEDAMFAGVDWLPVLVVAGWLMEREEDEPPTPAGW